MSTTTILDSHVRGDPFIRTFTLGNDWQFGDFSGGFKFTLRTSIPPSDTTTDTDAVDQASTATGEIVGSGTSGTITIPSARTDVWPGGVTLYWDLQGLINGSPAQKRTVDRGTIRIIGDVTRG